MAKVSMHLGFTFRVGDLATNQYGRIDMNVDQIDTELPLDEQLDGDDQLRDSDRDKNWELSLKEKILDIPGLGEKTAEKIIKNLNL